MASTQYSASHAVAPLIHQHFMLAAVFALILFAAPVYSQVGMGARIVVLDIGMIANPADPAEGDEAAAARLRALVAAELHKNPRLEVVDDLRTADFAVMSMVARINGRSRISLRVVERATRGQSDQHVIERGGMDLEGLAAPFASAVGDAVEELLGAPQHTTPRHQPGLRPMTPAREGVIRAVVVGPKLVAPPGGGGSAALPDQRLHALVVDRLAQDPRFEIVDVRDGAWYVTAPLAQDADRSRGSVFVMSPATLKIVASTPVTLDSEDPEVIAQAFATAIAEILGRLGPPSAGAAAVPGRETDSTFAAVQDTVSNPIRMGCGERVDPVGYVLFLGTELGLSPTQMERLRSLDAETRARNRPLAAA